MWNTIAWIAVGSGVVASLMELIKFKIYNNKATKVKMTLLGLLFSGALSPVLYFGFTLLGTPVAMVLYWIIMFIVQKYLDMKAIRPIIKNIIQKKMEKL
jgi:hypothetical protein